MSTHNELKERIGNNLLRVREGIANAAQRAGRTADSILLLGVTKYSSLDETRCLWELGCQDLAESRPQDLWDKAKQLSSDSIRWHFIGHLQRNKVRRTLPLISLLHSLDSQRLLEELAVEATRIERKQKVLIEVNISGDDAKTGLPPDQLQSLAEQCLAAEHIELKGLMGMAGLGSSLDETRRCFAYLRELRDSLQQRFPEAKLSELSMGMSGDYEAAIEAGSTMVRIGSALFE